MGWNSLSHKACSTNFIEFETCGVLPETLFRRILFSLYENNMYQYQIGNRTVNKCILTGGFYPQHHSLSVFSIGLTMGDSQAAVRNKIMCIFCNRYQSPFECFPKLSSLLIIDGNHNVFLMCIYICKTIHRCYDKYCKRAKKHIMA